jgi:hypothetical protein
VGRRDLDFVGFATYYDGWNIYATDGYTVGVARISCIQPRGESFALSKREAQDLLRFVRPTLKRHDSEMVQLLLAPKLVTDIPVIDGVAVEEADGELHVGLQTALPGEGEKTEPLSEVYEVITPEATFQDVYGLIRRVRPAHPETHPDIPYYPDFAARFAKAARKETDRLILSPRSAEGLSYGASYITVGENFEGAIAGMTYEQTEESAA